MIESILWFIFFLKKDLFLKIDFVVANDAVDSIAMQGIDLFLGIFKSFVVFGGNNLKTHKFNSILHMVDYIKIHGCQMKYDGSRSENIGKPKSKIMLSGPMSRNVLFIAILVRELPDVTVLIMYELPSTNGKDVGHHNILVIPI